jgi:hypothetical protein
MSESTAPLDPLEPSLEDATPCSTTDDVSGSRSRAYVKSLALRSPPMENIKEHLRPQLKISTKDGILLVIDKDLNHTELKSLSDHYSIYIVNDDDYKKCIVQLPKVDMYILKIENELLYKNCRGLSWYCRNLNRLAIYRKIYLRKTNLINDDDIDDLRLDYVLTHLPPANEVKHYFESQLMNDNHIRTNTPCCVFISCCCGNITFKDFCKYLWYGSLLT